MRSEEKFSVLNQLIQLAKVDGEIAQAEYDFLMSMAGMMGVTPYEMEKLMHDNVDVALPKLETERILQFHRLVLMANVDLNLDSNELNLLRKAGLKLGLIPEATNHVLAEMKNHEGGMVPPEKLMSIFSVYYN